MIKLPIVVLVLLGLFPDVFPVFSPLLFFIVMLLLPKKTNKLRKLAWEEG